MRCTKATRSRRRSGLPPPPLPASKIEPVITNHLSAIVGLLEQLDVTIANGLTAIAED